MTQYRVTYRRLKPAGAVQFDPRQEFIDIMDIPTSTPEEATFHLHRNMPYLEISRIEKLNSQSPARYGEARYGQSYYQAPSVIASGAMARWPDQPDLSNNLSTIAMSISEVVASYSGASAIVKTLQAIGVGEQFLYPLQKNIDVMKVEAERLTSELSRALGGQNQKKLQQLAGESEENRERQTLASDIVQEIVSCNLLAKRKLSFEVFNCSPEVVNFLHTPCTSGDSFKMKIGALASIFEIELKPLKALVKDGRNDWKSIKLIEALANQNSWTYDPKIFEVWRAIVYLRNATFPYHATDTRIVDLISFFGQTFPPDYAELWKAILKSLLVSITEFRKLLGTT